MNHTEMIALIQGGVESRGGVWADFGAGVGNFTRALHDLVGAGATVYGIDKDARTLDELKNAWDAPGATLHTLQADFTKGVDLPPLDGLLMANALHFVTDQPTMMQRLANHLKPGGGLLLVEYEVSRPRAWIPYPVPFKRFTELAVAGRFEPPQRVGERRSPSTGIAMYAALARRSTPEN